MLKEDLTAARVNTIEQDSYYAGLQQFANEPEKLRQYVYSHRLGARVPADDQERTRLENELFATELQLEQLTSVGVSMQQKTFLQNRQAQLQEQIAQIDKDFVQNQIAVAKAFAENAHEREKQLKAVYDKEFAEDPESQRPECGVCVHPRRVRDDREPVRQPPEADQCPGCQCELRGTEDSRAGEGDAGAEAVLAETVSGFCRSD